MHSYLIPDLGHIAATVPTLVVPIEKTLQADMEVRYKALTETKVCTRRIVHDRIHLIAKC
jgi:hypothetical protein